MAGDHGAVEFKLETSAAVVAEVVLSEEHQYFCRDRPQDIEDEEAMSFFGGSEGDADESQG